MQGKDKDSSNFQLLVAREQVALALDQKCPNSDGDSINRGETREL